MLDSILVLRAEELIRDFALLKTPNGGPIAVLVIPCCLKVRRCDLMAHMILVAGL